MNFDPKISPAPGGLQPDINSHAVDGGWSGVDFGDLANHFNPPIGRVFSNPKYAQPQNEGNPLPNQPAVPPLKR